MNIRDSVLDLVRQGVEDNEQIAARIREMLPGASTTAASVSSIKSVAKKQGLLESIPGQSGSAVVPTTGLEELAEDSDEPEEEIAERLTKRFAALDRMAKGVINGLVPAMIISGPAGLGKSWGIRTAITKATDEKEDFYSDVISGSITAVGLYIALWNAKNGGLVVLDDCDDVFRDETTLNILKAALDSGGRRIISWRKQSHWLKEMEIDDVFEFKGSVIFLTNVDFERQIAAGRPTAVHFRALMDRSLYLSLAIRSKKDIIVRMKQVVYEHKMLEKMGLEAEEVDSIMEFVMENKDRFYHLSLRLLHQIGLCFMADNENWAVDVEMTKMRIGS